MLTPRHSLMLSQINCQIQVNAVMIRTVLLTKTVLMLNSASVVLQMIVMVNSHTKCSSLFVVAVMILLFVMIQTVMPGKILQAQDMIK